MKTNTTTLSTTKVVITKRGYVMWLKKLHEEKPYGSIATISRYTAYESPIGLYCKEMGVSAFDGPKWVQKVREYYENKMHGMTYTATDAVYHMVELWGYKYSAIFHGDEKEYNEAAARYK